MNVFYIRVSSVFQNTDRQRINENDFDLVIEDKVSGGVSFFDREGGKEIKKLIDNNLIKSLSVLSIDRLGRDVRDILNTIHYFNNKGICINFISQGLSTLDKEGNENVNAKLVISILGMVSELEKTLIRERQMEGIRIAKLKGKYKGRKTNSNEDVLQFLSKPKNKKAVEYLKKGYKGVEVAKITGLNVNTISKIRKALNSI